MILQKKKKNHCDEKKSPCGNCSELIENESKWTLYVGQQS